MDQTVDTVESSVSPTIAAVSWMARHHGLPFTELALKDRLPEGFQLDSVTGFARALDAIGLKSRSVRMPLAKIDPGSLPVVLFRSNGSPVLLIGKDDDKRTVAVLEPVSAEMEERTFGEMKRLVTRTVLLAAPKLETVTSRLSPDAVRINDGKRHWLFTELMRHKAAWAQVVLAAFVINLAGLALPIFIMNVFDRVLPNLAFITLTTLAVGVVIALCLDLFLRVLRGAIIQRVSRRADLSLASKLFRIALSQRLLSRKGGAAGAITNLRDFETVRDFFTSSTLVSLIDLAFIGIFLSVLWLIVGELAWVAVAAIPVILLLAVVAQIPIARSAREAQQMSVKRNVVLIEALSGLETVKSVGAEPVLQREWENAVATSSRVTAKTRNWANFTSSASVITQQAVSVGIIVWGIFLVSEGAITIGALIAANILSGRILSPLAGIAQTIFRANFAIWSVRSITQFLEAEVERRDALRSDLRVERGEIFLNQVSFKYPDAKVNALSEISAHFRPGEVTALLGRIGSGKSTLGKILNGTIKSDHGSIRVDGYEISQYEPAQLRKGVGYLPQEPVLFTGTIRENITVGLPEARSNDMKRALYIAGVDAFVAGLPEGLDYFIGEKGERLSGGQKQALALARLLLRRPKLLFLDEPTNAMDHGTETLVVARLHELIAEGVGMVISTHRMSLAGIADRCIVLEQGRKMMDGELSTVLGQLGSGGTDNIGAPR